MVLDALAQDQGVRFRDHGRWHEARGRIGPEECWLVKPMTFINDSGRPVQEFLSRRGDAAGRFAVVFDDLALPYGRIRIREQGSDGGHQGMASIIAVLGTAEFPRVRIGISEPPPGVDAADYVLNGFTPDERRFLPDVVAAGRDALKLIVEQGIVPAMNRFNSFRIPGLDPEPDADAESVPTPEDAEGEQ
jgi:PTH1 family peptidyl-tRNA hydrolase